MTTPSMKVKVRFRTCRNGDESAPTPKPTGPTSIARRIGLAHLIEDLIERGELSCYAEAANRLCLTRARITQIADLALLAPDIQAAVLLGHVEPRDRHLREVGRHPLWEDQRRVFHQLFPNAPKDMKARVHIPSLLPSLHSASERTTRSETALVSFTNETGSSRSPTTRRSSVRPTTTSAPAFRQ